MTDLRLPQALPFVQNGRQCWTSVLPVSEIVNLTLPNRHGRQMSLFQITNREIEPSHATELAKYLQSPGWALPSIILAITQGAARTNPQNEFGAPAGALRILDGQHRIKALADLIANNGETRSELLQQELAVTIIEVKDPEDQARIWLDFAKNKQIGGAWQDAVDNSKPFVRTAKIAIEQSSILKGRTRIGRTKIKGHQDTDLLT